MGVFSNPLAIASAIVNPTSLVANAAAMAIGGGLDYIAAEQDRKAQEAAAREANQLRRDEIERNIALQREFAQHGIRWRVEDAIAAGLHPLAALGTQAAAFSPVSTVFDGGNVSRGNSTRALSAMGQNISRAVLSMATQEEREFKALQLARARLENELLETQIKGAEIANTKAVGTGPGLPSNSGMPALTGQGNWRGTSNAYVQETPLSRIHSQPGRPAQEVGAVPDYAFARTNKGLAIVPSKDVKEKIEDQLIPEIMWALRNQLAPNFDRFPKPDPRYYPLPKGYSEWRWDWRKQEFRPWRHEAPFKGSRKDLNKRLSAEYGW